MRHLLWEQEVPGSTPGCPTTAIICTIPRWTNQISQRQCHNENGKPKTKHKTEEAAFRALPKTPRPGTRPYECGLCGYWHLGRAPTPKKQHDWTRKMIDRRDDLVVELGYRVVENLVYQNHGR